MGATFNTGYLENLILYNSSNNIGIGIAADATYKVKLGGSLSGTSATFSSSVLIGTTTSFSSPLVTNIGAGAAGSLNNQIAMTHTGASTAYYIKTIRATASDEPEGIAFVQNATTRFSISSTGAATFSSTVRAQDAFYAADGTSTSASIRFWLANTGLYHPGSDALGIITAGTEKMRITSSGQLYVNTTNWPTSVAGNVAGRHMFGGTNQPIVFLWNEATPAANNQSNLWLGAKSATGATYIGGGYIVGALENATDSKGYLAFRVTDATASTNEAMRINSDSYLLIKAGAADYTGNYLQLSGNQVYNPGGDLYLNPKASSNVLIGTTTSAKVGIGTSSPGSKLQVEGGEIRATTSNAGIAMYYTSSNGELAAYNWGAGAYLNLNLVGLSHTFQTSGTERMRITSGGNVGINTTTISEVLDIEGNFDLRNSGTYSTSLSRGIVYRSSTISYGIQPIARIDFLTQGDAASAMTFTTRNGAADYTERMRITSNGNINFNDTVYNNTAVATTRTLYIGSDYRIGGISSIRESKKNIENISNIDWIYSLRPVAFNYRKKDSEGNYTDEIYDEINYGLIAEDTAPIADFLINYNDKKDGSKEMIGIEYMRLITPMLKAIQELKTELDTANEQIEILKNK